MKLFSDQGYVKNILLLDFKRYQNFRVMTVKHLTQKNVIQNLLFIKLKGP